MSRRFNVTGPCVPGRDFMVDLSARLKRPLTALRRGESLLLVRARQTGKTTLLREMTAALRRENFAVALCSLQVAEDQSLLGLYRTIESAVRQAYPLPSLPKWTPTEPQSLSFCTWVGEAQRHIGRPLILILDEYDAPPRKLVTSLLRSFRSALSLQDEGRPFVHALCLCGKTHVRDLRDELRPPGDESRGTGSLWNVAVPIHIGALSRSELDTLLDEYTQDSGVRWSREARAELYAQTRGQPWLVSRICYLLDDQLGCPRLEKGQNSDEPPPLPPHSRPPCAATIRSAITQLLDEDYAHLLSIGDTLQNRREAQELVLRLLGGEDIALVRASDVQSYLLDLGVLVPSESGQYVEIHNPIYAGHLGRWLAEQGS